MTVPEKLVKFDGEWHSSQAMVAVPFGGTAGMWPVDPEGGTTSVGGAML
jgi:hypothetical protein